MTSKIFSEIVNDVMKGYPDFVGPLPKFYFNPKIVSNWDELPIKDGTFQVETKFGPMFCIPDTDIEEFEVRN